MQLHADNPEQNDTFTSYCALTSVSPRPSRLQSPFLLHEIPQCLLTRNKTIAYRSTLYQFALRNRQPNSSGKVGELLHRSKMSSLKNRRTVTQNNREICRCINYLVTCSSTSS